MNVILLFFCAQAFCVAAGFGVSYSILRKTSYSSLSVLVAPVVFPGMLVLLLTMGGYKIPQHLTPSWTLLLTLPFMMYSILVIWWDRRTFAVELVHFQRTGLVLVASTIFALISLAPDIAANNFTYIRHALNQELLNYAAAASHVLGRTIHNAYGPAYQQLRPGRSGAELLLALLAGWLNVPPTNCVAFLVALLRAHAISAFGFMLLRVTNLEIAAKPWLLYSGLALFSMFPIQSINYSVSFLSHYCVAPVAILLVAFLQFKEDISNLRILGLMSLLYLYILVTYPEFLPILLVIHAFQAVAMGLQTKSGRLFCLAASPPVIAIAMNPLLAIERVQYIVSQSSVKAGFIMLASPFDGPITYFSTVLGLRFPVLSIRAFGNRLVDAVATGVILMCFIIAVASVIWYQRQHWAIPAALIFIGAVIFAWPSKPVTEGPTTVYKSNKAMVYVNFLLVAALVLAVAEKKNRRSVRGFLSAGYGLILFASLLISAKAAIRFAEWPNAYPLADVVAGMKTIPKGMPIVLPGGEGISAMYWNGVLQYYGFVDRFGDTATHTHGGALYDGSIINGDIRPLESLSAAEPRITITDIAEDGSCEVSDPLQALLYRGRSFCFFSGAGRRP